MPKAESSERPAASPRRYGFKWSVAAGLTVLVVSALFISNARTTSQVASEGR